MKKILLVGDSIRMGYDKTIQKTFEDVAEVYYSSDNYECEKGIGYAAKVQAESPIVAKWNEYMKDVMEMDTDPETGAQPLMTEVFFLK